MPEDKLITVVYKGHAKLLHTDYNGKRYCFYQNIPRETPLAVYNEIRSSRSVDAENLLIVEVKREEVKDNKIGSKKK